MTACDADGITERMSERNDSHDSGSRLAPERIAAYLERIGVAAPEAAAIASGARRPTGELLRELHRRHLLTVPFENLSIHLDEDISLSRDDLLAKVVDARRGGFCYELNGAFAALLTSLGYHVTHLSARVHTHDRLGPPFDHLTLKVESEVGEAGVDEVGGTEVGGTGPGSRGPLAPEPRPTERRTAESRPPEPRPQEPRTAEPPSTEPVTTKEPLREAWLVDVGFGRHSTYPLRFDERGDQHDPGGIFRIVAAPEGDLDVLRDGVPQYRLETRPRTLPDFEATCWWQRTSPSSGFTRAPTCSRLTETGRVTLSGRTLITTTRTEHHSAETRQEVELPESALLDAYREHFDFTLTRIPGRDR
jgi:N-hydroxyarylamine O-acetyltransferase